MNDADKKKVGDAIGLINNIEGQLENVTKRGPNAAKRWADTAKTRSTPAVAKTINEVLVPSLKGVIAGAKPVLKDLAALYKEGTDAKRLATHADWKAFRAMATLKLASCKALDVNATRLVAAWTATLKPGYLLDGNDVEVKATLDSLKNFSTYLNAMRIALAKP